ncbi:outer membrane lipoprotein carrier protein LolA, partial [Morganella morganii]
KNISKPLISKGQMLLSQEKGLWWQQQVPFVTTLILRDNEMIQRMEGQPDQVITAENNPQMFQFNALMRALIKADKAVLETHFTTTFTDQGQGKWQLDLIPVTTPLDKLFSSVRLNGSQVIERVVLTDKQGDTTTITFSDHRLTPEILTTDEAHYFD